MMDKELECDFIFGKDNISVKRMDTSVLKNSIDIPNIHFGATKWYRQPGLLVKTKDYNVIINDLGIYCLSVWIMLLLAKIRGQKIYHWDHGWYGKESFARKWIKRLYFGLADGSFIYGDYAIRLMKENGFNGKKLYPIHNSLDYEKQVELRNSIQLKSIYKEHFANDNPVLIIIGRLNLRKNLNLLIESIAILKESYEFYNVILVGDGEDRKPMEELSHKLGVSSQVWFYGACYDEATNAELIYNADMCVVPGDIGLTAIHAMTFGIPVVSHDYFPNQGPEFEAIKEGVTGAFFKHNDVDSLSATIHDWFEKHKDDRMDVRKACYKEIAENWTPEYQLNIIKKVING